MSSQTVSQKTVLAALVVLTMGAAARATDVTLGSWVQQLKLSGDYRLRFENFSYNQDKGDRNRERHRLRIGAELPLPHNLTVKTRFATGTGEQVSTNQTFGNLSSQEGFWVDRAYVEWKPLSFLKVNGGRMANPLWTQASSDILWDDDFNPEGAAEGVERLVGPVKLFANSLQMVLSEDKNTNKDQFLFSHQIGGEVRLPLDSRLKLGFAQHYWTNVSTNTSSRVLPIGGKPFGESVVQDGNRRASDGRLLNRFNVSELTAQLSGWVFHIPVALQGTYIRNVGAIEKYSPKANTGFQHGVILGKAAAAHSWEAAYFVKHIPSDATVADVADSDFGEGGTNRKGRLWWVAYNPEEWLQAKLKFFTTATLDRSLSPGAKDVNRFQADLSVKF